MTSSKKKRKLGPRRKRMRRQDRLQAAKCWIEVYTGKNILKGYKNWFGVDLPCAIQELKTLGIKFDDQYIAQVLKNREQSLSLRNNKINEKRNSDLDNYQSDSDENFYFIAGYTSWGFPYGVTWEEMADADLLTMKEELL